jgi:hypothetical protein
MNENFSQRLKHSILKLKLQQFLLEISEAFMLMHIEQKQNTVIPHMVMKRHKL